MSSPRSTAGGTERQLLQLVGIAQKSDLLPQICVLRNTHWLTPEIAGCPVWHCGLERIRSVVRSRKMRQISRWMRKEKFSHLADLLQGSQHSGGAVVGTVAGVPIIVGTRRNLNHIEDEVDGLGSHGRYRN